MLVFYSAEIGLKNQLTRFASIWSPQKNCFIRKLVGRSPIRFICHSSFVSQPDPRQGRGDSVTVSLDCLIPRRLAGYAQISDRVRNRRSRPLSSENIPPRPGTTSMIRSVCFQTSYCERLI